MCALRAQFILKKYKISAQAEGLVRFILKWEILS